MEDGTNDFDNIVKRAAAKLRDAGNQVKITQQWQKTNRRGNFKAIAVGISFGHGQKLMSSL
jgi:menaquinone-dependent protoporphyrinogen IX oxidase